MKWLIVLALVVAVSAINYECSSANLNVRSGAGTSYSINWVASSGDKFQVLSTNGVWHQVKAASGSRCGNTGWAHSDYLSTCSGSGDCNSTPSGPVSSGPTAGSYVTPNNSLNVRSGASTSNSVQWVAQPGDAFQVISSSNGWSNLRAASGTNCGRTGYASSQYLVATSARTCSSTPPPPAPTGQYPLYKQCNPSWGGSRLGTASSDETICTAGCAMSSVAMAVSRYGTDYNPGQLNTWLQSHGGFSGALIVWSAVSSLGLSAAVHVGLDQNGLVSACNAGRPVIANVNGGRHWVLVTGYAGGSNFYVNDPGYTRSTYAFSDMVRGNFVV